MQSSYTVTDFINQVYDAGRTCMEQIVGKSMLGTHDNRVITNKIGGVMLALRASDDAFLNGVNSNLLTYALSDEQNFRKVSYFWLAMHWLLSAQMHANKSDEELLVKIRTVFIGDREADSLPRNTSELLSSINFGQIDSSRVVISFVPGFGDKDYTLLLCSIKNQGHPGSIRNVFGRIPILANDALYWIYTLLQMLSTRTSAVLFSYYSREVNPAFSSNVTFGSGIGTLPYHPLRFLSNRDYYGHTASLINRYHALLPDSYAVDNMRGDQSRATVLLPSEQSALDIERSACIPWIARDSDNLAVIYHRLRRIEVERSLFSKHLHHLKSGGLIYDLSNKVVHHTITASLQQAMNLSVTQLNELPLTGYIYFGAHFRNHDPRDDHFVDGMYFERINDTDADDVEINGVEIRLSLTRKDGTTAPHWIGARESHQKVLLDENEDIPFCEIIKMHRILAMEIELFFSSLGSEVNALIGEQIFSGKQLELVEQFCEGNVDSLAKIYEKLSLRDVCEHLKICLPFALAALAHVNHVEKSSDYDHSVISVPMENHGITKNSEDGAAYVIINTQSSFSSMGINPGEKIH